MDDVDDARELVTQRMRDQGMEESIFEGVIALLDGFEKEREAHLTEMLDSIEEPGWEDLVDDWQDECEELLGKLETLEDAILDRLDDSQTSTMSTNERMAAVGPVDFLAGERRAWELLQKGDIPRYAALMGKILDTDIAVIRKCEEDLRKVRDDDKVVEALIQANFTSITTKVRDLAAKYSITGIPRLLVLLIEDPVTRAMANEKLKEIETLLEQNYQAAKQKRVVRQTVLDNIKLMTDAREKLSEEWLDKLLTEGTAAATAVRDVGRAGDYEAADWEDFGKACSQALAERNEQAVEQSRRIYGELLPTFIEENTRAFAALTDDPATLQKFTSDLQDTFETIDDLLEGEEDYLDDIVEGAYRQAAAATLAEIKRLLADTWALITTRTKASDDEVTQ